MINFDTRSLALGDGVITAVGFDFLVTKKSDVLLSIVQTGVATITFRGDSAVYLSNLTFDSVLGGGTATLLVALAAGKTLYIDLDVQEPGQPNAFRLVNNYLTSFRAIEQALDYVVTQIQTLSRWSERSVRLPRHVNALTFDAKLPEGVADVANADRIVLINPTSTGWAISSKTWTTLISEYATAVASAAAAAVSAAAALVSQVAALASQTAAAASAAVALTAANALTVTVTVDNFNGDGVTVNFVLSVNPQIENNTDVFISGVYQQKNTYSLVGTTLTFSEAPPVGTANVEVVMHSALTGVVLDGSVPDIKLTTVVRVPTVTDQAVVGDDVILANPTAASFVVTLPALAGARVGKKIVIKNIATNANFIQVKGSGAETVDNANTYATNILTMDSLTVVRHTTGWYSI